MRNPLSRILARLKGRAHPGLDELVALGTGLSPVSALARIHLERCGSCREQVRLIQQQWRQLVCASSAEPHGFRSREALLEEILALIQRWDPASSREAGQRAAPRPAVHRAVARRLAAELEIQLGTLAASLTEPARDGEAPVHAMLARTGHLLSTFLGYRAAVRLSQAALKLTGSASKR